jgi:hypothetical protein
MSFINNQWVVGTVCSLFSGLIVFLITNWWISRRDDKEVQQKITAANNEILHSLRSQIAERVLPAEGVLDSMVSSLARKHEVKRQDLFSRRHFVEEIIAEIMGNDFLSSNQKADYCAFVLQMVGDDHGSTTEPAPITAHLKDKGRREVSFILGAATFGSVLLWIVSNTLGTGTVALNKENIKSTLYYIALAIIIPTLCLLIGDLWRDFRDLKQLEGTGVSSKEQQDK